MSVESSGRAKELFLAAVEIASAAGRATFLNDACAGDDALRRRIEALIMAHERSESLLDHAAPQLEADAVPDVTIELSNGERPGMQVGPYKLLQQLGEGGMGTVFLAERQHPVKQRVALKIIKQGMDSRKFIARFEAERQALAMMDHPNIAKVLDAGCSESGRPYFVMELIKGIPITQFCDENRLTTRERLEMFIQVCRAVQHAHHKGIIHRDLKPSNVLVALYDDRPVPKVIDFGVAKATAANQQLTERTLFTEIGCILGTWEYMSPEQAVLNQLDVDTRSDVYSLGVLLYELLTGVTPLDRQCLREGQLEETLRIIREVEPPKPSTRVSSLGQAATATAGYRKCTPETLATEIQGDLDWIVMKALEKDRARRYDSASRLAEDVQRWLKNERIEARPPSVWYLVRKSYQRHKAPVLAVAAVFASLVAGLGGLLVMNGRLEHTMASLVNSTLREAVIAALSGDTEKAQVAVAQANAAGAALGDIDLVKGLIALNAGEYDLAIALGNQSISEASTIQGPDHVAARALVFTGSFWSGTHAPVDRITPQMVERGTEIDSVLAAYSMAGISPVSSLRILSKYSGVARSPVGLFIRAQAELMVSSDSGDLEQRQSALQDLVVAQFLLRDSGHSVMWRLSSLAGTIEQAKAAGRVNDASRFAAEATPLVPLLVNVPGTEWVRWTYCRAIGDEEGMLEACRAASTSRIHLFVAAHCMTRNRDDADALRQFEELTRDKPRNTKWARLARAYLVRALPDGAARVRELVADLTSDPDALTRRLALSALCLGCSVAEVEEYAKKAAASFPPFWVGDDDLWKGDACIAYLAGKLDAEELQKTVGTGRFSLSNAHCTIGLKCLARSDRQGAFEHFQAAVATQMWGSYDYELAWAFYTRMQADSNWPHWLDEEPR